MCGNHFNTIYVSSTPRRTVLLPNAVPYRWDENVDGNKDDGQQYDEDDDDGVGAGEYNSEEKQASTTVDARDVDLLEMQVDGTDDNQREQNHSIDLLDVNAIIEDDEDGDEIIMDVNTKSQKHSMGAPGLAPTPASAPTTSVIKIGEPIVGCTIGGKRVLIVQQAQKQQKHRTSLQGASDFMGHVTKRQKLNKDQPSVDQQQYKVHVMDSKTSVQHGYNNGDGGGNGEDTDGSAGESGNGIATTTTDNAVALEHAIPIDDTTNHPDIATFNLKGEEFIQMPKRIYLAQRAQFVADLKRYRSIIQNIKNQVNSID